MAMSRSIGARSFTTFSPIRISPAVMVSRPATMRSVVVFPQPDGPTRTTNSLSRICRFTSLTACRSSYFLLRFLRTTCAIAISAGSERASKHERCLADESSLHRSGQAGDIVLDEKRVDQGDRNGAQQRTRHQRSPVEHVAADKLGGDADGHRFLLGRRQEHEGVDE